MIKTLLFGAGDGCRRFIKNEKESRLFLAVVDNDSSRVGEDFEGLNIILPSMINDFEYEEIVITTQWAEQVKKQLLNDLAVKEEQIFVPAKNSLKKPQPFMHNPTWTLATQVLKTLTQAAYEDKINLLVDFGTLLGLVRDKQVMPWDDDIDFAVHIKDIGKIEDWLISTIEKYEFPVKFSIEKRVDKNNRFVALLLKFESKLYNSFTTSISFREDINGQSIHLPSLGLWYASSEHFSSYDIYEWEGVSVKVPHRPETYLSFLYGDWQTPKKFINMTDYENLGDVDFEEFKKVGFKSETIR